jgi:hypothetical protein
MRIRDSTNTSQTYFDGKRRTKEEMIVISGQFKERISCGDEWFGDLYEKPLNMHSVCTICCPPIQRLRGVVPGRTGTFLLLKNLCNRHLKLTTVHVRKRNIKCFLKAAKNPELTSGLTIETHLICHFVDAKPFRCLFYHFFDLVTLFKFKSQGLSLFDSVRVPHDSSIFKYVLH